MSSAARELDVQQTASVHRALREFADAWPGHEGLSRVRAMVCWNALMCHVDSGDPGGQAVVVLADIAALASHGDPRMVVEHGKCAAELMAYLWNAGRPHEAAVVASSAESSLRSPHYLQDRRQANRQAPTEFLEVLDMVLADLGDRP